MTIKETDSNNSESFLNEKHHGTYLLRRKYKKTLLIATISVNGFILLLFLAVFLKLKYDSFTEFVNIEHIDIEYYNIDTLLNAQLVPPIDKIKEPSPNTFKVVDTVKKDSFIIKKTLATDSLTKGKDTSLVNKSEPKVDSVSRQKVYSSVDIMPEFPGGKQLLYQYITNKLMLYNKTLLGNTSGKMIASFCIDENGQISNAYIRKSLNPQLDSTVIRAIRTMPKWTPGKMGKDNVKVIIHLPLVFLKKE